MATIRFALVVWAAAWLLTLPLLMQRIEAWLGPYIFAGLFPLLFCAWFVVFFCGRWVVITILRRTEQ